MDNSGRGVPRRCRRPVDAPPDVRASSSGHNNAVNRWRSTQTASGWSPPGAISSQGLGLEEGEELHTFRGMTAPSTSLFHRERRTCCCPGTTGTYARWDPTRKSAHSELTGHPRDALSVAFSPDRPLIRSISRKDMTVRVWTPKLASVDRTGVGSGRASRVRRRRFVRNRRGLKADIPGELIVWDVAIGETQVHPRRAQEVHQRDRVQPGRSPPGFGRGDNSHTKPRRVKVWDMATGKELFAFRPRWAW